MLKCNIWLKLHQLTLMKAAGILITSAQDQTVLFIEISVPSVLFMQTENCLPKLQI